MSLFLINRVLSRFMSLGNSKNQLASYLAYSTIGFTIAPIILLLLGVNFGSQTHLANFNNLSTADSANLLEALAGAFVHLLLEWSSVTIAAVTAVLAFAQYRITKNAATAIIGVALLCTGGIDAFHALAATKLTHSVNDNSNFIPFTWAFSRMFNALILLAGVSVFIFGIHKKLDRAAQDRFVIFTSLIFLIISYTVVRFCAVSNNLPNTQFPDQWITRPYDVIPLILFIVLGLWAFPRFRRTENNIFSYALLWSMVPAVATQLHMAFGSTELYDPHFNIGHYLKTISYIVPFVGITIDYFITYKEQKTKLTELKKAHHQLEIQNKELSQIAYITSHDLQEPLRSLMSMCDIFEQEYKGKLEPEAEQLLDYIMQASQRMSLLVRDIMDYNRLGKDQVLSTIDCHQLLNAIQQDLSTQIKEHSAVIETTDIPLQVKGYKTELRLLFQNLIGNAIKFKRPDTPPHIVIECTQTAKHWLFSVKDNGIGLASKHYQKIFLMFQRLHKKDAYEGTGIGLAHCKKIVNMHGGEIWVDSEIGEGATFYFTIPK